MSADHVCQPEGDCNLEVTCDGTSDVCPVTTDSHKPNATFCSSNTRTCVKGRCAGSICVHLGENATECQCVDSDEHLCDICCKVDGECKSTFSLSRSHEVRVCVCTCFCVHIIVDYVQMCCGPCVHKC